MQLCVPGTQLSPVEASHKTEVLYPNKEMNNTINKTTDATQSVPAWDTYSIHVELSISYTKCINVNYPA